jgi:16S rRNA (uracil1498-N3)-methyltransferase
VSRRGADPDGGGGPHCFVGDLGRPRLDEADRQHLERSLRLAPGDRLTISDGHGRWCPARLTADGVAPDGDVVEVVRLSPPLVVAFAPVKGDRPEWAVQKLTEAGVDRILVFAAARSVVRWEGPRAARQRQRLAKVAREAAMQCRRSWLPEIGMLGGFAEAAALSGAVLAQRGGAPPDVHQHHTVLVGPEGGWAPEELAHGLPTVAFGVQQLRAETAAVAAGLVLTALRSGLVATGPGSAAEQPEASDEPVQQPSRPTLTLVGDADPVAPDEPPAEPVEGPVQHDDPAT